MSVKKALRELEKAGLLCQKFGGGSRRKHLYVDLGAERSSAYAMENVFCVIDQRFCSGKPLIVTTNLTLGKLKGETDVDKKRIYDRILGMCVSVKVEGTSRRAKIARDKVQEVKTLLNV